MITTLTGNLREFVDRSGPISDEIDRTLMAVMGERLRRVLAGSDDWGEAEGLNAALADAREALGRYDARLAGGEAPGGDGLSEEIEVLLSELRVLADVEGSGRNGEAVVRLADQIAECLWVASASCRGGRLTEDALRRVSAATKEGIATLAPGLPELLERAVVRLATYGVDERFPFVEGWLEELAHLAPSRAALRLALSAPS